MVRIGDKNISHIYQGSNLVTDSNIDTQTIRLGDNPISFVYQGSDLLYPNPIKDNLKLYYDFKGLSNTSIDKDIAKDLSNNNNNGVLKNFLFGEGAGYNSNLYFDGIDDYIAIESNVGNSFTISLTIKTEPVSTGYILSANSIYFYIRKHSNGLDMAILNNTNKQEVFRVPNFFSDFGNKKVNIVYVVNSEDKKVYLYSNGMLKHNFDMNEKSIDKLTLTGIGIWNKSYFYKGDLYSVQVYDRALSQDEVEHNYLLEKERWNLD